MKALAEIYHIELTTPYHLQTNGCIERLHGTLESLLSKANTRGLDWESFLPLAVQLSRTEIQGFHQLSWSWVITFEHPWTCYMMDG